MNDFCSALTIVGAHATAIPCSYVVGNATEDLLRESSNTMQVFASSAALGLTYAVIIGIGIARCWQVRRPPPPA